MYGLIGKAMCVPGKRDEFIAILLEGVGGMPGCLSYIVARDPNDGDALWITEVWDSEASHAASLSLPAVKAAIAKGRALIAGFGERYVTEARRRIRARTSRPLNRARVSGRGGGRSPPFAPSRAFSRATTGTRLVSSEADRALAEGVALEIIRVRFHHGGAHHVEAAMRVERRESDETAIPLENRDPVADDFVCVGHDRPDRLAQRIQCGP